MNAVAKLCRHGFILQTYRHKLTVVGTNSEWTADETHQRTSLSHFFYFLFFLSYLFLSTLSLSLLGNLVQLDYVATKLKLVGEDKNMTKNLATILHKEAGNPTFSYSAQVIFYPFLIFFSHLVVLLS